jgi:hypothetical protein
MCDRIMDSDKQRREKTVLGKVPIPAGLSAEGVWRGIPGLSFPPDDHFINFAIIYYISVQPPSEQRIKATLCIWERG